MIILLNSTFELANGTDRVASRICGKRGLRLVQITPETLYLRAVWPTFFPTRATRTVEMQIEVTMPPEADAATAEEVGLAFIASLPKGGPMSITLGTTTTSFAAFKLNDATFEQRGVSSLVIVTLTATEPDVAEEAREQFESGEFQEFE